MENKRKGNRKEHTEEEMKQLLAKKYTPTTTRILNGKLYVAMNDGILIPKVKQSKEIQREVSEQEGTLSGYRCTPRKRGSRGIL